MTALIYALVLTLTTTAAAADASATVPPAASPDAQATPNTTTPAASALSLETPAPPGSQAWLAHAHALRFEQDQPSNLTLAELYITGVIYGAMTGTGIFYGMADLSAGVAAPLYTLPIAGGIVGAYALSHQKPRLHGGVLTAVNFGILAGYIDGMFLSFAVTPSDAGGSTIARAATSTGWVVASLGGAAGGYLAHRWGATTGDLAIMSTTTFWGAITGLILPSLFNDDPGLALTSTSVLLGSLAGTGVGVSLAAYYDFSRARSWFLDLGAVAGLAVSSSILAGGEVSSHRARAGVTLAGEAVGLVAAGLLTHALDVPEFDMPLAMHIAPSPIAWTSATSGITSFVPGLAMNGAF